MIKALILVLLIGTICCENEGSLKDLNLNNKHVMKKVKRLANFGLKKIAEKRLNESINGAELNHTEQNLKYSLVKVLSAKKQIVAGEMYYIKLIMKQVVGCKNSNCIREDCNLQIWETLWEMIKLKLTYFKCKKLNSTNMKISSNDDQNALKIGSNHIRLI